MEKIFKSVEHKKNKKWKLLLVSIFQKKKKKEKRKINKKGKI
jgi:DNA-binding transcriptional regulator PaaX